MKKIFKPVPVVDRRTGKTVGHVLADRREVARQATEAAGYKVAHTLRNLAGNGLWGLGVTQPLGRNVRAW